MALAVAHKEAPLGAITVLRVVNAVLASKDAVIAWYEVRKTRNLLANLSDAQLDDIGLTRSDVI